MYHTSENLTSLTSTCCCFHLDNGVFRGLDYFHNGYTGRFIWIREGIDITLAGPRYEYMNYLPIRYGRICFVARRPEPVENKELWPETQQNKKTLDGCDGLELNRAYARAAIGIGTISRFRHLGDKEGFVAGGGGGGGGGGGDGGGYGGSGGSKRVCKCERNNGCREFFMFD